MNGPPVVFFVYNRLSTTSRVFERICAAKPDTLLIVADGPKEDRPEDVARCEAVRKLVSQPTWKCNLGLNIAPSNLGFNRRISSGLAWAFSLFDEAIILEDDCLPDPSFFPFCKELLERYRFEERVKMISGCNFQFGRRRGDDSYYMSRNVGTWGWATWRRAFQEYDPEMKEWSRFRSTDLLTRVWPVAEAAEYWRLRFDEAYRRDVDAWDYQWAFSMWQHDGVQVVSNSNLIQYIGCLADTAHTVDLTAPFCNVPIAPVQFPLRHPRAMQVDGTADLFEFYRVFLNLDAEEADRRSASAAASVARTE